MTPEDLAAHRADWVEPIAMAYNGVHLHEIPPNGQGIAALIALGILQHLELQRFAADSAESLHLQIEAMKCAFAEVFRHVADIDHMPVPPRSCSPTTGWPPRPRASAWTAPARKAAACRPAAARCT